jgi:N4-gp56 family major capsid protein
MATTTMANMINPQVMGDMINAKIEAQLKLTPYAKVDTTLQGVPGDTKTVPSWNYIGDATNVSENSELDYSQMSASTKTFTICKAGKGVQITTEAINSGLGNPVGQAESQLAKSIAGKVDNDVLAAALTATVTVGDGTAAIGYAGIVDAVTKFEDEEDGIEKVMFISPKQEAALLKDPDFLSADKFTAGVAVNGAIGKIAGCWIKKSNKIKAKSGVFTNPIIKLEADSAETEYTEDELPALTIFLKKDTTVNSFYNQDFDRHEITAYRYYGVALTNDSKVVLAKFAEASA